MKYLHLIRFKNLIMLALMQCIIRYGVLIPLGITVNLSSLGFILLVGSTVCIAAGGYIINDIYDREADRINKPKKQYIGTRISEKTGLTLYIILNIIGLICGLLLANKVGKSTFFVLFIFIAAGLHLYASMIKPIALLGNLVVSLFVAVAVLIIGVFELFPIGTNVLSPEQLMGWRIILDYVLFAGVLTFIRELVKDLEDIQGDHKVGYKTLPIIMGIERTARFTAIIGMLSIFGYSLYFFVYLFDVRWQLLASLVFIIIPLIYSSTQLWNATNKKQFSKISLVLKFTMFLGIILLPFIAKTLYNAR